MWLRLEGKEQLLVELQLLAGVLVECLEVEWILRVDFLVGQKTADVSTKVLLMLDDLVKRNLVLDEQRNLDIELVDILLG